MIIDDEKELSDIIKDHLDFEGFEAVTAYSGTEGMKALLSCKPSLIILDIMLGDCNGMDLCKTIREKFNIPIIMLSAKANESDKIISFALGADDYVTKPFSPGELMARVKAHLRRANNSSEKSKEEELRFGDLYINNKTYGVKVKDRNIELKGKEFELLWLLATNKGCVFSKEKIFDLVWGFNEYGDINTVTVHIRRLREKIEVNPSNPKYIKTVWGVGYKFQEVED